MQVLGAAPTFLSWAAHSPTMPPAAWERTTVAPEPEVFHPRSPVSKLGLPTSAGLTTTRVAAVLTCPAESVTVVVTTYAPGSAYVCFAAASCCGPVSGDPSPKLKLYCTTFVPLLPTEADASAVTSNGATPVDGVAVTDAIGAAGWQSDEPESGDACPASGTKVQS